MADKKTSISKEAIAPKATKTEKEIAERLKLPESIPAYAPNVEVQKTQEYIKRRINEMMDFRKGLGIEARWREADEEYVPHELDFGTTRKRFETDQDSGLRSRLVPVGDASQQWRSAASAPTLLAKIQTALSLIFDNQPEAELVALQKKFTGTTDLAYSLWKRNWSITDAKEKYKLFIFNLFKYGWAVQRTYPRLVSYPKKVLKSIDTENPDKNVYEDQQIEWFNDVDRQNLDPFRTWIDELSTPYDPYSTNEGYYEIDYSYDQFMTEFGVYPGSKFVRPNSALVRMDNAGKTNRQQVGRASTNSDSKQRQDVVTVGFFESRLKDLFAIWIPKDNIIVYQSPLPNDDGLISITHTLLVLRNAKLPYGTSLWEILRQNKQLYDKMKNMTMDQLVLSIMKFGFYNGTSMALGDGLIQIVPGQARQITNSSGSAKDAVNWMEIPGPGGESWKGLEFLQASMDDETGITPTLEGEITGKTLGEILHAKESALKRLKTPVQNIAWAIEQDAYLSMSWMGQLYAIPAIKEFTSLEDMVSYEKEEGVNHEELFGDVDPENPDKYIKLTATYLPEIALHLEDNEGKLVQGKESQFFKISNQESKPNEKTKRIKPSQLKWKGIFKVIPRSIIDSSQELVKASKMELFNIMAPLLQAPPEIMAKPLREIIKANEEDPKDWLPDAFLQFLDTGQVPPPPGAPGMPPNGAPPGPEGAPGAIPPAGGQSMQANAGTAPNGGAPTVLPASQIPQQIKAGQPGGLFNRKL